VLSIGFVMPLNYVQNMSPWVNGIVLGFALVALALAWEARRGRYHTKTLLFAFLTGLNLIWFPNGGSLGSIPLYFFLVSLYVVVFFEGAFRHLGIALAVADMIGLHLLELARPGLARPFHAPMDRFLDLSAAYVVTLLTCTMILGVVLRGFKAERRRIKQSLADLQRSETALAESQAHMTAVFDSTADLIWSVDARTLGLLTFNAALKESFIQLRGINLKSGMTQAELFPPGPHRDYWEEAYRRALAEGPFTEEYRSFARGNRFLITFNLLERSGEIFGISVFGRDITERTRLEEERKALDAQMHQLEKMESLGSLAGGVAHDMNNILGAILGLASVHERRAEKDSSLARDLHTITQACQRGGTLVRGLLGFARKGLAEEREVDLNTLVREEAALLERTTLQKIRLVTDLAGDLRAMKGDPAALGSALMNLCVNAVDAMPEGGTLTLRTRNEGEASVLLEVEDSGCGMPREVLDQALVPFFTTKPLGKGTGLGLSMVYATAKAHEGGLDMRSEPGQGTRIALTFPSLASSRQARAPRDAPAPGPLQAPLHVLLVDDDEFMRESIAAVLEALGHTATLASDGGAALACLEQGLATDLVIMDMNMPGLDGAATLPRLRTLNPTVPVLLATGRVDRRALELVDAFHGVRLLSKPFNIRELEHQLAEATSGGYHPRPA